MNKTLSHSTVLTPHLVLGFQFDSRVGGLQGNADFMVGKIRQYASQDRPVVLVFPEMALTGYPLQDLVLTHAFTEDVWQVVIDRILPEVGPNMAVVVGLPIIMNGKLYNAAVWISNHQVMHVFTKSKLPNTSVFDEVRVFTPGKPSVVTWRGITYGVPICEDVWHPEVAIAMQQMGAQILLSPNASPYDVGKWEKRKAVLEARVLETGLPLLYVNRWGGQDELVFDGQSALVLPSLETFRAVMYEDAAISFLFDGKTVMQVDVDKPFVQMTLPAERHAHLMAGMAYVKSNPKGNAVIGLSGGIDSAFVYIYAVLTLGAKNVLAVRLPSGFSSEGSLVDAEALVKAVGGTMVTISIEEIAALYRKIFGEILRIPDGVADENLQARIRGVINMLLSNMGYGWVMTTGNKSEMAVGYATLYGDMNGAFNPIKDLYKTEVFEQSLWLAEQDFIVKMYPDLPAPLVRIATKPPSAELRADQKDTDSLPPYDILDAILKEIIEIRKVPREITLPNVPPATIARVYGLMQEPSEFKRRQACPGIRWHASDLDKDWRQPLDKAGWRPTDATPTQAIALMNTLGQRFAV